jgi:hypothetical protein
MVETSAVRFEMLASGVEEVANRFTGLLYAIF